MLEARTVLHERALPEVERRLGISAGAVSKLADRACTEPLEQLGEIDRGHAGWALLWAGTIVARNSEQLAPPIEGRPAGAPFTTGLAWAGLLMAVVGDRLIPTEISRVGDEHDEQWEPSRGGELRNLADALAGEMVGLFASEGSRERLVKDSLADLNAKLPGLDRRHGGWGVLVLAVWIGSSAQTAIAPLTARTRVGRRRLRDPRRATLGCAYGAAVLAQLGTGILDNL